jgi:two-component system chemotaxis sensor kinase CheA
MSDAGATVQEILDQIAVEVMTVGLDDLRGVARIHTELEQLALLGQSSGRSRLTDLATGLAALVSRIILDECEDIADPLDLLARGVALLQRLEIAHQRHGGETDEVNVPPEMLALCTSNNIGLDPVPPATEDPDDEPSVEEWAAAEAAGGAAPSAPSPPVLKPASESQSLPVDADIFFDFLSEAEEHLATAETTLLSLETTPGDVELINGVFRSFHTIKGAAGFLNLTEVTRVAHTVEDVLDSARKGKLSITTAILDSALQSIDLLKALLTGVQKRLEGGSPPPQDIDGFVARLVQAVGQGGPPPPAAAPSAAVTAAPAEVETAAGRDAAQGTESKHLDQGFVRVGTGKLDQLVNMVGELVIAQTQVSQNPEVRRLVSEKLTRDLAQLGRITRDIQEVAMSMRMVPIRPTFERMARMVRDLARKLDKPVEFRMSGEETELDKNMVEEIVDPLIHMVRNAVDHGIEATADRVAAGKPAKGSVALEAHHQGGSIVIELQDDGKGLDRARILAKAVERGLARGDEEFSDEQVYDFLFRPGFSLAKAVSDISGRGVGMDVVRRSIEKLRGKVEVRSAVGRGSTFAIRLPLTLAIIEGMVVGVGRERYVLPLTSIIRSLRPAPDQIHTVMGEGEMVQVQGELFPLLRLHERFAIAPRSEKPWEGLVVVIEAEGGRGCLLVDELLGIQQVVIKGLEDELRQDPSLAGCTILGDGRVGLILDANGLVDSAGVGASLPGAASVSTADLVGTTG